MQRRIHARDLPKKLLTIINFINNDPEGVSRLDMARKFSGALINRLIESGHLAEAYGNGREWLIVSPLTLKELNKLGSWSKAEDKRLIGAWPKGIPVRVISSNLGRTGGEVVSRAWELDLIRHKKGHDHFGAEVMAWRVKRCRAALVEAERRGLDMADTGEGLEHRALQRRFLSGRNCLSPQARSWSNDDIALLRTLRDGSKSLFRMAQILDRSVEGGAKRLLLEGRSIGGFWSPEEDQCMVEGVKNGFEYKKIASHLPGRSVKAVKFRVRQLRDAHMGRGRPWTEVEHNQLLAGVTKGLRGRKLTAQVPSRGHEAARRHLYALTNGSREYKPWTELDFHILLHGIKRKDTPEEIAKWLSRDVSSVKKRVDDFKSRRPGRETKLTLERAKEAKRLLNNPGATGKNVADKFNVSPAALYRAFHKYGLNVEE